MDILEQGEPASERVRRRNQLIFAVVVAVLLGSGTAVLLRGQPGATPAPAAAPSTQAPAVLDAPPAPSPVDSPGPAPSPSPSRRAVAPSHRPSPKPSVVPSSPPPAPAVYAVTKPMCRYVDFAPINALSKPVGKPSVSSNVKHFVGADNVFYFCNGYTGDVVVRYIGAMIYPTATEASDTYINDKSFAPETAEPFHDLGDDAWGYPFDVDTYDIYVLAGNLILQVILQAKTGPTLDKVRAVVISTARALLPKLRRP
jgi:hypothetical protein